MPSGGGDEADELKGLPLEIQMDAKNPFEGWFQRPFVIIRMLRDPDGTIRLASNDDDTLEWLASYQTGIVRELTDDERAANAPLGAQKLYQAIKGKPVKTARDSDSR